MPKVRDRGSWRGFVRGVLELGAPIFYSGLLGPVLPRLFAHRYRNPDPWNYAGSPYEHRKYDLKVELLKTVSAERSYCRALELGSGEAAFTERLVHAGVAEEIVGMDFVASAVARARERLADVPHVSFVEGNVSEGLPEGPFDLILCSEILYYLGPSRRVRAFAQRVMDVLAPGGDLLVLSAWPAARVIHRPFTRHRELELVAEHVEHDDTRPYLLQVLRRS